MIRSVKPKSVPAPEYLQTRGVLAGAYRASDPKSFLTHAVIVDAEGRELAVVCKRVKLDSIADEYALPEVERNERPSCTYCQPTWDASQALRGHQ